MNEQTDDLTGEVLPAVRQATPPVIVPLASPSCAQVWTALAVAQGKFESPKRTKEATIEGQTKSGGAYKYKYKYAPLEEIERVIRKPLSENGLFRQQYLVSRGGQWMIRTVIGHSSGEWIACDYPIYASKEGAQGFASGVTYARRYGLSLALGLAPEDDDDAHIADSAPVNDAVPVVDKATRATPAVSPQSASRDVAVAIAARIRSDIKGARAIDHLNRTGIFSKSAEQDKATIIAQQKGANVWQDLVDLDSTKRKELLSDLPDDPIPDLAPEPEFRI